MAPSDDDPLALIPAPADRRLALRVTPAAQRALRQGHPWVFRQAVTSERGEGRPGDLAVIFDDYRRFMAIGLYDPDSPIRVRVLQHDEPAPIGRDWLQARLSAAAAWRATLPASGTTGYRLVHGENDGLPGLVVDRYEDTLVLKVYTAAWVPHLADLRAALAAICPSARLVLRLSRELARRPEYLYGLTNGSILSGTPLEGPVAFSENGLRFEADVVQGQKTGFFFDQRDNRARVERLAAGRRVLNVFAYTGGFSLYAARGGAAEILSLDASVPALAAAGRNFALNRDVPAVAAAKHRVLAADAFAALAELAACRERFNLVIVDPPALAKQADEIPAALAAYGRLTDLALGVLAPGGTLVMASCSSRVSAPVFFGAVHRAAAQAGRPLHELDRTGHALDHPVRFPEGAYLKCLYAAA
jgi:23S rRNA (cytosine1962-C5)-methyltransferase